MRYDICIIGGAGHVGLPLGVAFANAGVKTVLCDINRASLEKIRRGVFPFKEEGGPRLLRRALKRGTLAVSENPDVISKAPFVLFVIGTPVDEYLNPNVSSFMRAIDAHFPYFRSGQILILRSTIYPGTSERIQRHLLERGKRVRVAFCPERIAQGHALHEIEMLPQIISAFDRRTLGEVGRLFSRVTKKKMIAVRPIEAELAKLFSNAWRYIKFAVGNQFFMIADQHHLDYDKIFRAMREDYPRNADLPPPGFAAGPCLLKDTMQLAAFHANNFFLGHAAMLVNEGMPDYLVQQLKRRMAHGAGRPGMPLPIATFASVNPISAWSRSLAKRDLKAKTVGILGMAFKGDSDDHRDSLAYKLRKVAQAEARRVLCHDVYIKDPSFVPLQTVLRESDVVILAAPHREYAKIDPRRYRGKEFVDIWNFWPKREARSALV